MDIIENYVGLKRKEDMRSEITMRIKIYVQNPKVESTWWRGRRHMSLAIKIDLGHPEKCNVQKKHIKIDLI